MASLSQWLDFRMVHGLPPQRWYSEEGSLYLTSPSKSNDGESTKSCANLEPNLGHMVQSWMHYPLSHHFSLVMSSSRLFLSSPVRTSTGTDLLNHVLKASQCETFGDFLTGLVLSWADNSVGRPLFSVTIWLRRVEDKMVLKPGILAWHATHKATASLLNDEWCILVVEMFSGVRLFVVVFMGAWMCLLHVEQNLK